LEVAVLCGVAARRLRARETDLETVNGLRMFDLDIAVSEGEALGGTIIVKLPIEEWLR
jgi:hypothetical protein